MVHLSEEGSQTQAAEEHVAVGVEASEASLGRNPKTWRKTTVLLLDTHSRITA